jgi:Na+-driven multidrug efflux pump
LLFTGLWGWGVAGAAYATIIGQGFSFFYAMYFLYRNKESFGFDFKRSSFKIHKDVFNKLVRLGVPLAIQSASINVSMLFVNTLVNQVGVFASAVFGVGTKIDNIVNKVTQSFNFATSSIVGQNIAARNLDRVKKAVYWCSAYSAAFYAIFTVFLLTCSGPMYSLFTDDPNVISLSPIFVSAIVWGFPGMALLRSTFGMVHGIGNAPLSMVLGIMDGFLFRILLSYLFGIVLGYGLWGFFFGFGLAPYGAVLPGMYYFFSGKWKTFRPLAAAGEADAED